MASQQQQLSTLTRWGLTSVAALGAVILLYLGKWFFIPPVMALLLAALLWPVVNWLNRQLRFPWMLSCLVVLIGLLLANLGVTIGITLAVPRLLQDMPNLQTDTGQQQFYELIREQVKKASPVELDDVYWPPSAKDSRVFNYVKDTLSGKFVTDLLVSLGYYANSWLWQWILIMFILLFLLVEGRMLSRRIVQVVGASPEVQSKAVAALGDMAHQVRNYLWWRTIINIGMGVVCFSFYSYMGLRQPLTWALLTGILTYVPYIGPLMAGVPAVIDAFVSCPSPWYALAVIIVYMVILVLEGYLVFPLLMGRSMELNATTVMLACLFWELVWGLPGLFLAMPLMAAIKAVCFHIPDLKPWANLMSITEVECNGEEDELTASDRSNSRSEEKPENLLDSPSSSVGAHQRR